MSNVVGSGIARTLVDSDGDALDDGAGKLNVNATLVAGATIDIGDVDMFLDGGTALVGGNGTASAGTLRVTIASDTTGVLSVDDNGSTLSIDDGGGAITVDGTVTANLSSTDNTVLDNILTKNTEIDAVLDTIKVDTEAIETAVELLDNAISGSEMQVDIVSSATLNVNSHAVTNAGTFAVQVDGSALTALQLIDDVIYVDDADWTDGSSKHLLVGGLYQSSPQTVTDGDVAPLMVNANGRLSVETEQDDAFGSWKNYADFAAETGTSQALNHANHCNESITDAKEIIIQTDDANTGFVMVGYAQGSTLAGSVGSRSGIKLNGGETFVLSIASFASVFLIGSASTQYVNVAYFK